MKSLFNHSPIDLTSTSSQKSFTLLFIFLFSASYLFSAEVDMAQTKRVAKNYFAAKTDKTPDQITVFKTITESRKDIPLIHIHNIVGGGFVLVAANDVSKPIIGFAFDGKFQQDDYAPAFENQLELYKEQIYQAIIKDVKPFPSATVQWEKYNDEHNLAEGEKSKSVSALLSSAWGQGEFYNAACPVDPGGPDGHALVGCTAVAIAQVLNYWSYPWRGQSSHGYSHDDYGWLYADFENTLYNYDSMPNVLNTHNSYVANLLYHCGVSVDMDYGPDGSAAWSWVWPYSEIVHDALIDYFNFKSTANCKLRSSYPDGDWIDLLKEELDAGRPVIYGGNDLGDVTSGHSWVVDGYNDDFFHMNWGWYGSHDGYFTIEDLTPGDNNYNGYNHAVFEAEPKVGELNGTITLAESPYEINYDHVVPLGDMLTIEPGVEFIFRGRYKLFVLGQVDALGTVADTIVFRSVDPVHGWGGLRFLGVNSPDSSRFRYCKFTESIGYHKSTLGLAQPLGLNSGGAVHCKNTPALSFIHCLFKGNRSHEVGGAIYCGASSDILIDHCVISNNLARTQGGGLGIENSSPEIRNSIIQYNENETSGGGIWLDDASLTLTNDSILYNKSSYGGGVACRESNLTMNNVVIRKDSAHIQGGGILCELNSSVLMDNVTISFNNSEKEGGGLLLSGSTMEMNNSKINSNRSSTRHGGGIYCGPNGSSTINNSLIYLNAADSAGGIFITDNAAFNIENVTISHNSGSINSDEVTIHNGNFNSKNSIIWYMYGDTLRVTGSSNLSCTYSNIKGGMGKSWFGTGCIDSNPQFSNSYYYGFDLLWPSYPDPTTKSPCIDTGDPVSPNDPDGTIRDMGAIPFEQVYTPLPGGDISGVLSCAGSPYYVNGDITVAVGDELIIEPCVYLVFRGDYRLRVEGRLLAEGTPTEKIGFMPSDTLEGWQGIWFWYLNTNGQDSSKLIHNRVMYGNADGYGELGQGGGLLINQSSNLLVSDSYFFRNKSRERGGGIYIKNISSPLIRRCSFVGNESLEGGAICAYGNVFPEIENCIMVDNTAEFGGAIAALTCNMGLAGNSMLKNRATKFGGGLYLSGGTVPVFHEVNRCSVYDNYANWAGLDFYSAVDPPPVAEVFLDSGSVNVFNDHFAYPVEFFEISSNHFLFNQEDSDLYVSVTGDDEQNGTSPSTPLRTISVALKKIIADANNPRTIHVGAGIYNKEQGERFPLNLRSHVTLRGNSSGNTFINGDSLYQLMTSYADVNDSIVKVRLKHGYAEDGGGAVFIENNSNPVFYDVIMESNYSDHHGGAVGCYDFCSPVFNKVSFVNNYSDNSGGGVYSQSNDTLLFEDVYFDFNTARHSGGGAHLAYDNYCWIKNSNVTNNEVSNGSGGGLKLGNGSARLDNVMIEYNQVDQYGGGIHAYGLDLELNNSSVLNNVAGRYGGGCYLYNQVDAIMHNVVFKDNSSGSGGAIYNHLWSTLNIKNGLFVNNFTFFHATLSGDGGALYLWDVETSLTNVTISDNVADGTGGGLFCNNNTFSIQNSILWGNSPEQVTTDGTVVHDVQYSNVEDSWVGTGNLNTDPLFTNPGVDHYSLQATSPCINTGNPDTIGLSLPMFDLEGSPRISGGNIDMGAMEYFEGVELSLRVYLQGPFNGFSMGNKLNSKGILPMEQPYSSAPWNYSGSEEASLFPNPSVVDWLFLEVRDAADISQATNASITGRQAVLLLSDGRIKNIFGLNPRFGDAIENNCFVTIRHRNHLGIISALPLSEIAGVYEYNFTTPSGQAYGTDAQAGLGGDVFGMYGGDLNADGAINMSDKTSLWEIQAGKTGYLVGDLNLDGEVDNHDKNDVWLDNEGETGQVPE